MAAAASVLLLGIPFMRPEPRGFGLPRWNGMPPIYAIFARFANSGKNPASLGHVGCGARLVRDATRLDTDLLRESRLCCHSRHINLMPHA
jgi:hypothetical protein